MIKFIDGDTKRTPDRMFFVNVLLLERLVHVLHTLTLTFTLDVRVTFLPSYSSKMPVGKCKSNVDDTDHQRKRFFS